MRKQVIIPAAGYGTRMNCKPNESKEMMLVNGYPMIDWAIKHCLAVELPIIVNTRPEKEDLVRHLLSYAKLGQIELHLNPGTEWANTTSKSLALAQNFESQSLLILPDTRFDNIEYILKLFKYTNGWSTFIGTHVVEDPQNWGVIQDEEIIEKPKKSKSNLAWGVLSGDYYSFGSMAANKELNLMGSNVLKVPLINFRDLTRTGKLPDETK